MSDFKISPPRRFLVTGASGFIGRNLCKLLMASGYEVNYVAKSEDIELQALGVKWWHGHLLDPIVLQDALCNINVIVHCAGNAKFGNGPQYHRDNFELTNYLINAVLAHARTARFVLISTIGAIDRASYDPCNAPLTETDKAFPSSDYGTSKLKAENLLKTSGLEYSIIRPTMVVGSDMRIDSHFSTFARHSINNSLFARISWPGRFSIIHVKDLASAILFISLEPKAKNEIFFAGGGESMSVGDYLSQCSPNQMRLALPFAPLISRIFRKWLPFSIKAMMLPALTASDSKLIGLGWKSDCSAKLALIEIISREKCRMNPDISPGGITVITGAASGLGEALANSLSSKRDQLLLIDRDQINLEKIANKLGNCTIATVDLADADQVNSLLESPVWLKADITELYACAGIGKRGKIQEIPLQTHIDIFAVNVIARLTLAQNAIERMRRRHFGRVVLISSSSAFQPLPYMATYAASNSALLSIGESWNIELRREGVHIMTVCPGGMKTNFQENGGVKKIDGEKLMAPEYVVDKIFEGLRGRKSTMIISFRSFAMSILARILPRRLSANLWGKLMDNLR